MGIRKSLWIHQFQKLKDNICAKSRYLTDSHRWQTPQYSI